MTTNDNFQRLTKMPKSIKQIFPASSVAVVLGGHKSWDTYAHLEGDAWIVANADGMRLAITGRGRFIQLDEHAAKRLISALTEALNMHKLRGGPDVD